MNNHPKIIPPSHQYSWKDVTPVGQWVESMIPTGGSVLLFGPAGVGKTAFICNLMNAVASSQQFFSRNTNQTNCMLLSLDTPENIMKRRWLENIPQFQPGFYFVPEEPFNCLDPLFDQSILYSDLKKHVAENEIGLVVVDSLRDVFNGDMINDDTPKQVYNIFQQWFGGITVAFIHHTRKQQILNGKAVETNIDDEATGSKYWINKAQVALYLKRLNGQILSLQMGKSQCFKEWDEPIKFVLDGMNVSEWTKAKAQQDSTTYSTASAQCQAGDPNWGNLSEGEKDKAMAQHLGVSVPTVRRFKAAFRKMIP